MQEFSGSIQPRVQYRYNAAGEPVSIQKTRAGSASGNGGNAPSSVQRLYYNAQGQIAAIEGNADQSLIAHYAYNGARQRVAKVVTAAAANGKGSANVNANTNGATTYFTWHGGLLDAELDDEGRVTRRTLYLNLRPVTLLEYGYAAGGAGQTAAKPEVESARHFAIHGDHLGTPHAITDEQQRVVWAASYDTFGRANTKGLPRSEVFAGDGARNQLPSAGGLIRSALASGADDHDNQTFEFNLRFAGQYEDAETGWHFNWHRYYDPQTGRYLTPDPIGLRGGGNAFGYAGGDPLGAVDPWGLYTLPVGGTYNPPIIAPSSYGDRAEHYRIMQQQLQQAGLDVVWFGVAADLNQAFADAPDIIPGNGQVPGDPWLNNLGQWLWDKNRTTYLEVVASVRNGSCVGGRTLDYALVNREQNLVQQYINDNQPTNVERYAIDGTFTTLGRVGMPSYMRTAIANVESSTGQDFDFWNVNHRIRLGETLMDHARGGW